MTLTVQGDGSILQIQPKKGNVDVWIRCQEILMPSSPALDDRRHTLCSPRRSDLDLNKERARGFGVATGDLLNLCPASERVRSVLTVNL